MLLDIWLSLISRLPALVSPVTLRAVRLAVLVDTMLAVVSRSEVMLLMLADWNPKVEVPAC